jgi:hypothetical protein
VLGLNLSERDARLYKPLAPAHPYPTTVPSSTRLLTMSSDYEFSDYEYEDDEESMDVEDGT